MDEYINVNVRFWRDNFVVSLPFEEKSFYFYLMHNRKTNQCGRYKFSLKFAESELSLSNEKIKDLIKRFEDYGKVIYDEKTEEMIIVDFHRYQ
ncbi:hypothetical protein KPL33_13685 [Clostridium algidicarnis]|uniref:hypothetical protein n=1 Tax=Clostridium algidicarnis TaxID=37659 RepID=UPI001C0DC4FB|nr:hypothetical protein [Clostridium algidicarnis]MBU3207988.1 hypothetical protein [Clostridium algidicarnis]